MNIKNFNVVEGTTHYINIDCVHDDSNEKFYLEGYEVVFWLRTKNNDVIKFIISNKEDDDCILIKASNGMHFIEIVDELKKQLK